MKFQELEVSEATVEYSTAYSFGGHGFAGLRGAEVDEAGERAGPDTVLLAKRLAAAVHRANPALPADIVEQVVRTVQPVGRCNAACAEAGGTFDGEWRTI